MPSPLALFVNDLTIIDFSYIDWKNGIFGESWIVDIQLTGDVTEEGLIFDFSHVKHQVKAAIDEWVDHKLLIPTTYPHVRIDQTDAVIEVDGYYGDQQEVYLRCPSQAVAFFGAPAITQRLIKQHLETELKRILPFNVLDVVIGLRNEHIDGAFFQYSHGLKKHEGNCQRIVHGHRSQCFIFCDGERNTELEAQWCQQWQGIYLLAHEDLIDVLYRGGQPYCHSRYVASQGEFELILPQARCTLMPTETTIELIADYVHQQLSEQHNKPITVQIFEGINKGAIAVPFLS